MPLLVVELLPVPLEKSDRRDCSENLLLMVGAITEHLLSTLHDASFLIGRGRMMLLLRASGSDDVVSSCGGDGRTVSSSHM